MESFSCFTGIRSQIFESLVGLDSISTESERHLSGREEGYDLRIFGPLEDILFRILESSLTILEGIGDMGEHIESCLGIAS